MRLLALALPWLFVGSYQAQAAGASGFKPVRIRTGDNVISIMRDNGFSPSQRQIVLRTASRLDSLLLTTDMSYFREKRGGSVTLRIHDSMSDLAYKIWRKGSKAGVEREKPRWKIVTVRHQGRVRGSLMGSLLKKVRSNWVASRFIDAFTLDHDLETLAAGARFEFTVEKKYEHGNFVKYGEVLTAALEVDGKLMRRDFVRFAGGGVFINPLDLMSDRPLYAPVAYLRIASGFQPDRRHPITRRVQPHLGIDFELPEGAPVFAAKAGVVVRRGRNRAAGNYVVLRHSNGVETSYNHLSRLEPGLRQGSRVSKGRKIGEVGCTGYCTRPHLHFAVKMRGRMVDPARHLKVFPSQYEKSLEAAVASR